MSKTQQVRTTVGKLRDVLEAWIRENDPVYCWLSERLAYGDEHIDVEEALSERWNYHLENGEGQVLQIDPKELCVAEDIGTRKNE